VIYIVCNEIIHQEVCYTSLCKDSLNTDGHPLYQDQQTKQSTLIKGPGGSMSWIT